MMSKCPHCGVSLEGDPIPEVLQPFYGATHFTRKISVVDRYRDRVMYWKCPDCCGTWDWSTRRFHAPGLEGGE
jgi:hypothetical protein